MRYIITILALLAFTNSLANRITWADGSYYDFNYSPIGNKDVSEDSFKRYFNLYDSTLDPLEGIYDVEVGFIYLLNGYHQPQVNKGAYKMAICKDGDYLFSKIIFNDGMTHNSEPFLIFKRIGSTNAYYLYERSNLDEGFLPKHSERFVLNDNGTFSLEFGLSASEISTLNDNIREAMHGSKYVHRFYSAIKLFPESISTNQQDNYSWTGTGFALCNGYIATNFHVIDNASVISVTGINGNFSKDYSAEIVATDKTNDLAILNLSDATSPKFGTIPYSVITATSEVGEDVYVLGYPLTATMGDEIKLTTGVISSKTGFQGDIALYQISAPIQPGNSGGPLFDKKGNIIGIVSAKHSGAENVGYAIKASYLKTLVESFSTSSLLPSVNTISTYSLPNKVKAEKKFVFYIKCKP